MPILNVFDPEPQIKIIMKVIIITILTLFLCHALVAQDREIHKKSFEEYVMPGETIKSNHPAVIMDVDKATMYYVKSIRYDSLGKAFPELEEEFKRLDDSIQNVLQNTDSLLLVIAERDSVGNVMFQTCEEAKNRAIQTAIEQRGKVIRYMKIVRFFKPILIISASLNVALILLFIIVI